MKRQFYSELVVQLFFSSLINLRSCEFIMIGNRLCNSTKRGRDVDTKIMPEDTTTTPAPRITDREHQDLTYMFEGLVVGK